MKRVFLFVILISIVKFSEGQEFTDLTGDYLGQLPPKDTPVIFAPGIISRNSMEHGSAVFSSDGSKVFWMSRESQVNGGAGNLWFMERIGNRWTKPRNFAPFGENVAWMDPFLSADGKRLYFSADRSEIVKNEPEQGDKMENRDIWYIEKLGDSWSKPKIISSVIDTINGQSQASFTRNGTVYFLDYRWKEGVWSCDITRSVFQNGAYSTPKVLPVSINSPTQDWTPYIAFDDSYLIFSSQRQDSYGDLFISFHDTIHDTWSEPVGLGSAINTKSQEAFPTVSPDGKYLFFTRWTNEETDMDVYWVSTSVIDKIRNSIKTAK